MALTPPRLSARVILLAQLAAGCGVGDRLDAVEEAFLDARSWSDQIDVTRARSPDTSLHGFTLDSLRAEYLAARSRLLTALALIDSGTLSSEDRRALGVIREILDRDLGPDPAPALDAATDPPAACEYDPRQVMAGPDGVETLASWMFTCYGRAAQSIVLDGEPLDRLTILGLMGSTADPARRRRLFLALQPVWRSVNTDDGATSSPWRLVLRDRVERWGAGGFPHVQRARALGVPPDSVEPWLVRVLEAWRPLRAGDSLEPWDWYYLGGEAGRRLGDRVERDAMLGLNHRFYRSLGAGPDTLGIRYDIEPRSGKYPIAYTTFGARPRADGARWRTGEPWVFASYRVGGLDNLAELLHETGHGIHIAAIRTRPAFADWPDSDTFTEALADLAAHDLYEPAWQSAFLGDSVPLAVSLRAKYAGVMLDVAWSLFEIRLFQEPGRSPNEVWGEITSRYLGIRAHPEWSWWAMRGQLVNSPGYMLNYALGAMLVAQLRERVRAGREATDPGDPGWYAWVAERLYRFGRERPARDVVRDFLGAPIGPEALLRDLARARSGREQPTSSRPQALRRSPPDSVPGGVDTPRRRPPPPSPGAGSYPD